MKPVLIDVLRDVAFRGGIIGSYSDTIPPNRKTELINLVQSVREEAAAKAGLSSLILDEPLYIKIEADYTTGTVAVSNGSVSCVGTATVITAAMVGRKIRIGDDPTVYLIATRTSNLLFTINRPFMGTSETAGAIEIIKDIYDLPANVLSILNLKDTTNTLNVVESDAKHIHRAYPNPFDFTGNVVVYGKQGSKQATETLTVSAATTTTVTATTPAGDYDDYYVGWELYNQTREETREVINFAVSAGVITINQAITGQVSTDTIILKNSSQQIVVRNGPTSSLYLEGVGVRVPTKLVNDSDVVYEMPEDYADRLLKVGTLYKFGIGGKLPDNVSLSALRDEYNQILEDMTTAEQRVENRTYQFGSGRSGGELNPMSGAGWPAYPD